MVTEVIVTRVSTTVQVLFVRSRERESRQEFYAGCGFWGAGAINLCVLFGLSSAWADTECASRRIVNVIFERTFLENISSTYLVGLRSNPILSGDGQCNADRVRDPGRSECSTGDNCMAVDTTTDITITSSTFFLVSLLI
jgi:hypothetical protein